MRYSRHFLIICLLIISTELAFAQSLNIGIPFLRNIEKTEYYAGSQNWDIVQDKRGVVYYANNEGVLQFDGNVWRTYSLPNKTIVRSLAIDDVSLIYAGGQNEMGFFAPDKMGGLVYTSLRYKIPEEHRDFEDVWDIVINGEEVFFRTSRKIYHFHNNRITVTSSTGFINFICLIGDRIMIQDSKEGLKYYNNGLLESIEGTRVLTHSPISGVLPVEKDEWLITTQGTGFFMFDGLNLERWTPENQEFIVSSKVYTSTRFPNGNIALGTTSAGLFILNSEGRIIHHLHQNVGLLNNNVLSLFVDMNSNLWLGLDNGISLIMTNSPFSQLTPNENFNVTGYDIQLYNGHLYFGTSNGVYSISIKDINASSYALNYQTINNTMGQAWNFNVIENQLLLSHHSGSYIIENTDALKNYPLWGVWLFRQWNNNPRMLLAGTYTGLAVYEKFQGRWRFVRKIEGFEESSRFMEMDENNFIWVAHPYKGIYRITVDDQLISGEVKKYGKADGLSSDLLNHVFKIHDELIFCSEKGVYRYDPGTDRFKPYEAYNSIFGLNKGIRRLFEAPSGDIWYVTENDAGVLMIDDSNLFTRIKRISFPRLKDYLVKGFEVIYPMDEKNVFLGAENGFIYFNPQKSESANQSFHVVLNEVVVSALQDSVLFRGIFSENNRAIAEQPESQIVRLSHKLNAFRFSFSATDYSSLKSLQYQFYLEGFENSWLPWTKNALKEYTNLNAGDYTFRIKARNSNGIETENLDYKFTILPPWYTHTWAWISYIIIIAGFLAGGILSFNKKYQIQSEIARQSEKEVKRQKNELLKAEIAHKNKELISSTMHLTHKNELQTKIKNALVKLEHKCGNVESSKQIGEIIKMLSSEESSANVWKQLTSRFDEVHTDFFKQLKSRYPALSPKDRKMCAYLRMNLSTKEIATLLNMTTRGVEGSRYRLRQKLKLDKNASLIEFIMDI